MSDIPKSANELGENLVSAESLFDGGGQPEAFNDENDSIIQRLGSLALDEETVLVPHQVEAFNDAVTFYREGGREGYIQLPTGSGKTVIMVELSRLLLEATPEGQRRPRIMVLEPTIDLVNQTVGSVNAKTGKRRGFKAFANHLDVRALHGDVPTKQRDKNLLEAEILVTTYDTFRNLIADFAVAESKTTDQWESERWDLIAANREAEIKRDELIGQRRRFVKQAYLDQKVAQVGKRVEGVLRSKEVLGLDEVATAQFETLQELVTAGEPSKFVLKQFRKHVHSMITPRIKDGMEAYARTLERADQRRRETNKRKEMNLPRIEWQFDPEEELDKIYKHFTEQEAVVMQLMLDTRLKETPAVHDLLDYKSRQTAIEYTDQINGQRSRLIRTKNLIKGIDHFEVLKQAVSNFELLACDEVHRAIGSQTWNAIREYAEQRDIAIFGLTATDKYYDRDLEDYFEKKAHELDKIEAMKRKIINPVAVFVHDTGLRFQHVGLDAGGEYDRTTIRQMRFNEERNRLGVEYARMLSEHGYQGIMSAIPGDEGSHARVLAGLINRTEMLDPKTGETRLMRAQVVLQSTPDREAHYQAFEAGEIDWLTFVDVIREGWDSDAAKALINMRPTRSPLLATQRAGRIGRTYEDAPVSVVIDFHDGIEGEDSLDEIPPVTMADVYNLDSIEQGHIIGSDLHKDAPILAVLRQKLTQPIVARHNRYVELLARSPAISASGMALSSSSTHSAIEWQTLESIRKAFDGFLPREVVVEAIEAQPPLVRTIKGHRGYKTMLLFNVADVQKLHADSPEINPWKLYVDNDGEKWITPEGCTTLLSQRFPTIQADQVSNFIQQLEAESGTAFTKSVGRVQLTFSDRSHSKFGLASIYKLQEITDRLVPYLLQTL